MRHEEYTCDRCGGRADGAASVYWHQLPRTQPHDLTEIDLCPECAQGLREWLSARPGDTPEERKLT